MLLLYDQDGIHSIFTIKLELEKKITENRVSLLLLCTRLSIILTLSAMVIWIEDTYGKRFKMKSFFSGLLPQLTIERKSTGILDAWKESTKTSLILTLQKRRLR